MKLVRIIYFSSLILVAMGAANCVGVQWAAAATTAAKTSDDARSDSKAMALDPLGSTQIVGNLPYSNQWIYDRPSNYLYINADRIFLQSQSMTAGNFTVDYGARDFSVLSIDYFMRFGYLSQPGGTSFLRNFALWGRYRLGYGARDGQLSDASGEVIAGEKTSLNVIAGELALLLGYEALTWFKPYVGFNYSPYWFRNSSSSPGAEIQGRDSTYGPVLGAHFPLFFDNRCSLFGEIHRVIAPGSSNQLFDSGSSVDFGAGFVF